MLKPSRLAHESRKPRVMVLVTGVVVMASLLVSSTTATQANPSSTNSGTNAFDNMRDGWDSNEPQLTPADVSSSSFGQIFAPVQLKGQVYAQPVIAGGVLIVGTEANMVYGLNPQTGAVLWSRNLANDNASYPGIPDQKPWPAGSQTVDCGDLLPTMGITSTPVYDPATGSVYFTDKWDNGADHSVAHYYLHAVDPASGRERPNFPHEIRGHPSNDPTISFDAFTQLQRPGLLLLDGVVYMGFGSHCDYNGPLTSAPWSRPYRGFIVGVDSNSGAQTSMWTTETSTAVGGAGVWQAGTGLMSDGPGRIFFSTGNGVAPPVPPGSTWLPGSSAASVDTYSQSVIRLQVQPDRSLRAADFFSPASADLLDLHDMDISSGGPVALPDSFSTSPHLLSVQGKDGRLFLLDRDNLGGRAADGQPDRVLADLTTSPTLDAHYGRQAVWGGDGGYIYTVDQETGVRAYTFGLAGGQPTLADAGSSVMKYMSFASGSPIVTSDGTNSGSATVWMISMDGADGSNGVLHAFDAIPTDGVLNEIFNAPIGFATKFSTPMSYNGRVYVGTRCSPSAKPTASTPCTNGMLWGFGSPTNSRLTGSATDLGSTPVNQALSGSINLNAGSAGAVTITNVTAKAPFAATTTSHTIAAGASYALPISFTSASPGVFSGLVAVQTNAGTFNFSVRAIATQEELLVTSPKLVAGAVAFPLQATGIPRTINVRISNMSSTSEQITDVASPASPFSLGGSVSLPVTLQPAGQPDSSVVLPVVFEPTTAPDDGSTQTFTARIDVTGSANLPTHPSCTSCILLSGTAVLAKPLVTYSPRRISFGQVAVGASKIRSFTITNGGNLPVTIVKAKPPVSDFTSTRPVDEGTTIPVGESIKVDVRFAPTSVGSRSDRYILTPSAGSPLTLITFSGTGVDRPGAPASVSIVPNGSSIMTSWSRATSTGGLPITGYSVSTSPVAKSCTTSAYTTHCTITGLIRGRVYSVSVRARNSLGASRRPKMVTFVAGAPSAPRNLKITPVSTGVSRLLWTSPLSSSRQPVTNYATRISADSGRTWSTWTNRSGKVHQALLTGCAQGATCIVQIHALNRFGVGISSSIRFIQRI